MMRSDILYPSITPLLYAIRPFPAKDGLSLVPLDGTCCWLCGFKTLRGIPRREILRPSFANLDFARAPNSAYLCPACAYCLEEPAFRRSCFLASDDLGFMPFKRTEGLTLLRDIASRVWGCYLTHSYRKYHFLRTPMNINRQKGEPCAVQFEGHPVRIDRVFWELVSVMERLLPYGTKGELQTGEYRLKTIERIGIKDFLEAEELLKPHRNSRQFHLAIFLC